jgi:sec-independent protein translocase protein TatA
MGLGGVSIWKLLIVLLIVVLIFGTKHIKTLVADLTGGAKNFRKAMTDDADARPPKRLESTEPDAEFPERKDRSGRA